MGEVSATAGACNNVIVLFDHATAIFNEGACERMISSGRSDTLSNSIDSIGIKG